MLARLSIRDIVLIERLDIEFSRGLAVLTGETGAGKSILLDAFALALGGRGDAGLVRHGVEQGQVTAVFDVPKGHPASAILSDNGLDDTGEMILRRGQLADGRTRAFINDQAISVQTLKAVGSHSRVPALSAAVRRLERRAANLPALVEPAVKAIDAAINALEEADQHLNAALVAADFDPAELERIEERLFGLRAASRKYSTPVDGLAALAAQYAADVALIDAGADQLKKLETAAAEADKRYSAAAAKLSAARTKAAEKLDETVNAELAPLKLERATFTTQIESDPESPGPQGIDRIEFWVQTNPGTRPGPLMKVASGGELSRLLLALKVVLSDRGSAPTLVFDEIDTGVGGAVADAIGARLARLARKVQVMAVTHAPPVAAPANQHFLISKDALDQCKRVRTRVQPLDAHHLPAGIARQLAGAEITAEARAAAERLLRAATARWFSLA